jgi:hypothetical protein
MWTRISFEDAVRYIEGKVVRLQLDEVYISLADAKGVVLNLDDFSRIAAVSRCTAKPYDVDDDCVDGETEPVVTPCSPEFYLWEE